MPIVDPKDLYSSFQKAKTRKLIYEFVSDAEDKDATIFSVADMPKEDKIPLKVLYLSLSVEDPSEVAFAEEVFGDLSFWLELQSTAAMKPYIDEWRYLASLKRKQRAFKAIITAAEKGDTTASRLSASKYLIEEPWMLKGDARTKKDIRKKISDSASEALNVFSDDVKRLKEQGIIQ